MSIEKSATPPRRNIHRDIVDEPIVVSKPQRKRSISNGGGSPPRRPNNVPQPEAMIEEGQ